MLCMAEITLEVGVVVIVGVAVGAPGVPGLLGAFTEEMGT